MQKILKAEQRLDGFANKTPVLTSTELNKITKAEIFIKCENFQKGGAFKFRGAFNTISQLSEEQKEIGVITHSSGNHAQAVAISGRILGIKTVIVMPKDAPKVKVDATKGYGAQVVFSEPTQESRINTVNELIDQFGYYLVHPYDNDNIIAGAATSSKELHDEIKNLDIIITPVGGGGLISGTSYYTKETHPNCKVIAAEPVGANDAYRSFNENIHVKSQTPTTIADGLRTTLSERTHHYVTKYVDEIILVTDEQIIQAMKFLFYRMKIVVEPSGAVPIAVILNNRSKFENKRIGVIISGGNLDMMTLFEGLTPLDKI